MLKPDPECFQPVLPSVNPRPVSEADGGAVDEPRFVGVHGGSPLLDHQPLPQSASKANNWGGGLLGAHVMWMRPKF